MTESELRATSETAEPAITAPTSREQALPDAAVPAPVAAAPAPVPEPFVLATEQLAAVAHSAGLEWVNSDAGKIRAAQEAMANEPKPPRVARERKSAAVVDEGPLVLVETRKDLSQFRLPFETTAGQAPSRH